jgi:hypothetical protein
MADAACRGDCGNAKTALIGDDAERTPMTPKLRDPFLGFELHDCAVAYFKNKKRNSVP